MGQKGAWLRSRDLFFKFWDPPPILSLEWLKVQTSNFACGLKVRDCKQGNEKWFKWGRWPRSCDLLFQFFGSPDIYTEWLKIQNLYFASRLRVMDT